MLTFTTDFDPQNHPYKDYPYVKEYASYKEEYHYGDEDKKGKKGIWIPHHAPLTFNIAIAMHDAELHFRAQKLHIDDEVYTLR